MDERRNNPLIKAQEDIQKEAVELQQKQAQDKLEQEVLGQKLRADFDNLKPTLKREALEALGNSMILKVKETFEEAVKQISSKEKLDRTDYLILVDFANPERNIKPERFAEEYGRHEQTNFLAYSPIEDDFLMGVEALFVPPNLREKIIPARVILEFNHHIPTGNGEGDSYHLGIYSFIADVPKTTMFLNTYNINDRGFFELNNNGLERMSRQLATSLEKRNYHVHWQPRDDPGW